MTNASGGVVERRDYAPFGEELNQGVGSRDATYGTGTYPVVPGNPIETEFTGKIRDSETGLDYFGARYMSSAMGRFTSPDKLFADQHAQLPQSWNLYIYVRNNPLALIDGQGDAARQPVPGAKGYAYRADTNNQHDNPNFHIFNRKGKEIGRISVREVQTGTSSDGTPLTGLELHPVAEKGETIPNAVLEGIEGVVAEEGILPRFALGGGPFTGFTVNAMGSLSALLSVAPAAIDVYRTGIGMNMSPWNAGSLYITDTAKAASSLGNGRFINFTDSGGKATLYQVQNGVFVKPGCSGNDCELSNVAGGTFKVVNGPLN